MNQPITSSKAKALSGTLELPGDKSISHRALILASQTLGETRITGLLQADDVLNTKKALQTLGVPIEKNGKEFVVSGIGVGALKEPDNVLDLGNSGTGVRLLMGLVGSHAITASFTGDESLRSRPMGRITTPLEKMGTQIVAREEDGQVLLPLSITGHDNMLPISYTLPVASAQVKSAVLLAALNIPGETTVIEPQATRDHTERMLTYLGADIKSERKSDGVHITLKGQPELFSRDLDVPSDPSSAAFLVAAALMVPGSKVTIPNVCTNPLRTGFFRVLFEMGAKIILENKRESCGEPVADMTVEYSELRGFNVPGSWVPSMIDEFPILSVVAATAKGETRMNGLAELRVKESDRLAAIAEGLAANGVDREVGDDYLVVNGADSIPGGGQVKTYHDHRIAMSFLVMGMVSQQSVTVDSGAMIRTSFPEFTDLMTRAGAKLETSLV